MLLCFRRIVPWVIECLLYYVLDYVICRVSFLGTSFCWSPRVAKWFHDVVLLCLLTYSFQKQYNRFQSDTALYFLLVKHGSFNLITAIWKAFWMNLSCGGVLLQLRTRSFRVCLVELFNLLWLLKKSKTNQRGWLSTQSHSQKQLSASSILTAHLRLLPLAVKSIFSSKLLTCQWLCVPLCQNKTAHMPSFFFPADLLPARSVFSARLRHLRWPGP